MTKPIILAIQNDRTDPPHLAGRWLMELGFEIQILRAYLGESVPEVVPDGISALMPLGGHMGALDDHIADWLPNERAMLADAVARDIPIFAICLGAQLLAEATGGSVARVEVAEIGIYSIHIQNRITLTFCGDVNGINTNFRDLCSGNGSASSFG